MQLWAPDIGPPLRDSIRFSMWLKATSWKRPEPGITKTGRFFKRKGNSNIEMQERIRLLFTRACNLQGKLGILPWDGPVALHCHFRYRQPKDWWDGKELIHRPDVDNLVKNVMDALNPRGKGGFGGYKDDAQIIQLLTTKGYSVEGDSVVVQLLLFDKVAKPIRSRSGKSKAQ